MFDILDKTWATVINIIDMIFILTLAVVNVAEGGICTFTGWFNIEVYK